MNDNFAEMFWMLILIEAVIVWGVIEGLIWIFSHIGFHWI